MGGCVLGLGLGVGRLQVVLQRKFGERQLGEGSQVWQLQLPCSPQAPVSRMEGCQNKAGCTDPRHAPC